jgi:alpha-D-ribose 1-methylphosphonate 5-triphosphate synthase subunit PhnH
MPTSTQGSALTLFELRRYRARPGRRDELIAMFEAHFRPAYEAAGATILASWTAPAEPDRWVWIRAFTDARARREALKAFYGGSVWARLGAACNATIADASEARVLSALAAGELAHPPAREALPDGPGRPWAVTVLPLAEAGDAVAAAATAEARFTAAGAPPALALASAKEAVLLRRFESAEAELAFHLGAAGAAAVQGLPPGSRHWRLQPTGCSRLR